MKRTADPLADADEHWIQCQIISVYDQRRVPGTVLYAIPNGGHRDAVTGARLKAEGVREGIPDLQAIIGGRHPFIEVKKLKGRLSKAQKKRHAEIREAGGEVFVTYGFAKTLELIEQLGLIRKASQPFLRAA